MNKRFRVSAILLVAIVAASALVHAKSTRSYVTSVDNAIPGQDLYEVMISRLDGRMPPSSVNLEVQPGHHTVTLAVQMDSKWTNKLNLAVESYLNLTIDVEEATTYVLAGKVNPNASPDEQKAGTYWHPVIYETRTRH